MAAVGRQHGSDVVAASLAATVVRLSRNQHFKERKSWVYIFEEILDAYPEAVKGRYYLIIYSVTIVEIKVVNAHEGTGGEFASRLSWLIQAVLGRKNAYKTIYQFEQSVEPGSDTISILDNAEELLLGTTPETQSKVAKRLSEVVDQRRSEINEP
jgi:hypothetical protein